MPSGHVEPPFETLAVIYLAGEELVQRERWAGKSRSLSEASSPGQPQRVMERPQHAPHRSGPQRLQGPTCTIPLEGKRKWTPDCGLPFKTLVCFLACHLAW